MICVLCNQEVGKGNYSSDRNITCWKCVLFLCKSSQEKLRKLYNRLIGKELIDKATILNKLWLTEEEYNGEGGRAVGRGGPHKASVSTRQGRKEHSDKQLDT